MTDHQDCDWKEHKLLILNTLDEIQTSIGKLREEIAQQGRTKPARSANDWPKWKYVLLGAAICVPQIALEVADSLATTAPP